MPVLAHEVGVLKSTRAALGRDVDCGDGYVHLLQLEGIQQALEREVVDVRVPNRRATSVMSATSKPAGRYWSL